MKSILIICLLAAPFATALPEPMADKDSQLLQALDNRDTFGLNWMFGGNGHSHDGSDSAGSDSQDASTDPHRGSSGYNGDSQGNSSFSGQATFYSPSEDACGTSSSESDLVAALNAPQYDSTSSHGCGRRAHVTRNGKSVTVRIVDECPECAFGDLDLSPAAFNELADPDEGRVNVEWTWAQ